MEIDNVSFERLAAGASNIATHPVPLPENTVKEFLQEFPLQLLFSILARESQVTEKTSDVVEALQKIFQSPYGMTLLPQVMPYANTGLTAESPSIRQLACKSISKVLRTGDDAFVEILGSCQITGPLLRAICDDDSGVAKAAADAVTNLAKSPKGLELVFTEKGYTADVLLKELAMSGRALIRIRALSVTARIFGVSDAAARVVQDTGILGLLSKELANSNDTLAQISAVELLCELAETPNGESLLLAGNFVDQLIDLIGNPEIDGLVRSRSILVGAQLITAVSQSHGNSIVQAISACLARFDALDRSLSDGEKSEKEAAVVALGQIGSSAYGAEVILRGTGPGRYVVYAALMERGDSLHQAAILALARIAGSERTDVLLSEEAESSLRNTVFDVVHLSHSTSLSSKFLRLLRQASEIREATYRLLIPLVARPWCRRELSLNKDIVELMVDPRTETSKEGMEWRHLCCVALSTALGTAGDEIPDEVLEKLNTAVRRGPYLSNARGEATPVVATEERF